MRLRGGALCAFLLMIGGCGGAPATSSPSPAASSAAKTVPIKIAYSQPAAGFVTTWMAQDKGYFKKHGLNAEVLHIAPPADTQAVISGEIQIVVDGAAGVAAIANGANIPYIAITYPYFAQSLFGQPGIEKVSDIVGKQVAATTRGGSSDFALRTLLAKENIDPSQVNFVYLRDDSAILAAMQAGSIQAAIITSPNTLRARQSGLRQLVDMSTLKLRTVTQGVNVRRDWAQQHEDQVLAFLKGWMEGAKEARANPTEAKAVISKYTTITDQALLDESYKTVSPSWAAYPMPNDQDIQNIIDLSTEASVKAHKPADFYDSSYLKKLESFAKELYPGGLPPT